MNDTQLDAQLRTLYNLIYDSAFLIEELDSGICLLLAQNPHLQEKSIRSRLTKHGES